MNKDSLGDRMKDYERKSSSSLYTSLPVLVRLDGKSFHSFTKGLQKPYDKDLSDTMRQVTVELAKETNSLLSYTQSDEISLLFSRKSLDSQIYFDGKRDKIISVLAGLCSVVFNEIWSKKASYNKKRAIFDCRAFNVSDKVEAYNYFLWRERDAVRNSLQMLAQNNFSHNKLQNKNSSDLHNMLYDVGINWNNYPLFFKRGSYFKKVVYNYPYTTLELEDLPLLHSARTNPETNVSRTKIEEVLLNTNSISQLSNAADWMFTS